MIFFKDNYIKWYGNGPNFNVTIEKVTRPVKSYYEETCLIAEMTYEQRQGDLHLCYSGGLDSEYVLAVFKSLGMKIVPVIMRTQYNHHDTQYAFKYCEMLNIKPIIIDLDFDKFVESGEFLSIATEYKLGAYQLPANLWLTKQIDGTLVTGNNDPHLCLIDNIWYVDEIEPVFSQCNFFEKNNIYGTPFLLCHTPEQYYSFLTDPTIKKLASSLIPGKTGSNSSKVHVYNNQNKFILEQRVKQTGYEIVEQSKIFQHPDVQLVHSWKKDYWGTCNFEYFDLIERLSWTQ